MVLLNIFGIYGLKRCGLVGHSSCYSRSEVCIPSIRHVARVFERGGFLKGGVFFGGGGGVSNLILITYS